MESGKLFRRNDRRKPLESCYDIENGEGDLPSSTATTKTTSFNNGAHMFSDNGSIAQQQQQQQQLMDDDDDEEDAITWESSDSKQRKRRGRRRRINSSSSPNPQILPCLLILSTGILFLLLFLLLDDPPWRIFLLQSLIFFLGLIIPILTAIYVVLTSPNSNERLVSAAFVAPTLCTPFPKVVPGVLCALAATLFGLLTRPNAVPAEDKKNHVQRIKDQMIGDQQHTRHLHHPWFTNLSVKTRAILSALCMIGVLLMENFLVWVVSSTYIPSHEPPYPEPLQDNGRIVSTYILHTLAHIPDSTIQWIRNTINIPWAVLSSATVGWICCDLQLGRAATHGRTLWGLATRALWTVAMVRFIRSLSFIMTVLPSQVPNCYRRHFPYPPPTFGSMAWFQIGFLPMSKGGCNDLIISGHACITSTAICVASSVADNIMFTMSAFALLGVDFLIEVYQGYHYSVDMWLGAVLTCLIFSILQPLEHNHQNNNNNNNNKSDDDDHDHHGSTKHKPNMVSLLRSLNTVTVAEILFYATPALLAYLVVMVMSESIANIWVFLYIGGTIFAQCCGMPDYSRHILFCAYGIGLGVYL